MSFFTDLMLAIQNGSFILVAALVTAAVILIALLFQRVVFKNRVQNANRTRRITYTAMFSSIAGVLMLLELPLFFAPGFYKLDLSELPVMICAFFLGPLYGVIAEFLKVLIHLLLKGTSTAFVGDFANFIIGCTFILPASIIYHAKPSRKSALIGLITGTLCMTVFGSAFNGLYLIPKFAMLFFPDREYKAAIQVIVGMGKAVNKHITSVRSLVLWAVVPFNLVKGIIVSLVTFFIYKPISQALKMEFHKKKTM